MIKTHEIAKCVVVLTLLFASCNLLTAQKSNCGEIAAMAKMARAISPAELVAEKGKAGDSYRAQVVFAARQFELNPQAHDAALLLLNLIPNNDEQHLQLKSLGYSLCGTESYREMKSLDQIVEHIPRDMAKAVLLSPNKMPEYVAYSVASVLDPHSDYAIQMQKVCRARHPEFIDAVAKLSPDKKDRFLKYVFDPEGCNALALPEAN
jgi:hypothetical protein